VDRMLRIMRLVLACGLYHRHTEACATDIEIHPDSVKHSPLGLLSSYGRDEAPRRAFGASPAYNPPSPASIPYRPAPDARLGPHLLIPPFDIAFLQIPRYMRLEKFSLVRRRGFDVVTQESANRRMRQWPFRPMSHRMLAAGNGLGAKVPALALTKDAH
jgi:hypothetical protein